MDNRRGCCESALWLANAHGAGVHSGSDRGLTNRRVLVITAKNAASGQRLRTHDGIGVDPLLASGDRRGVACGHKKTQKNDTKLRDEVSLTNTREKLRPGYRWRLNGPCHLA
jgi:hypothetical protein